jgi:DNA repair exonuclease SbcCD ATPase subunit
MIPKRVELENFLSFAGKVEICFTDDEPLWVLSGPNGVGKSAVFDAITYALYGRHRAGEQKAEQLIRHGANGFRVVFEFEFAAKEYRITRTRQRAGRTTQKVERREGPGPDDWQAERGVNSAAEVKAWVERTLGLGAEAFTTSVLLRQGEADKLLSSSRDDRIAVLKGIIGFEKFEQLSERVHAETTRFKGDADTLRKQRQGKQEVTAEERATAEAALEAATAARAQATASRDAAVQRVERARQWQQLESQRTRLAGQLAEADTRAREAQTLQADKARLDDLAATVPALQKVLGLRLRMADLVGQLAAARAAVEEQTGQRLEKVSAADVARQKAEQHKEAADEAEREAKTLRAAIERGTKFLKLADEVEQLTVNLAQYPVDLADRVAAAVAAEKAAAQASRDTAASLSTAKAFLGQAQQQQQQFADVTVGVTCSRCGQVVTADHAAKERSRLAKEVRDREAKFKAAETAAQTAAQDHAAAEHRRAALEKDQKDSERDQVNLQHKRASLREFGGVADAAELRAQLTTQDGQRAVAEARRNTEHARQNEAAAEFTRLTAHVTSLDAAIRKSEGDRQRYQTACDTARGEEQAALDQLSPVWRSRLPNLNADAVANLAAEWDRLVCEDVAGRFEEWKQDATRRTEWQKQIEEVSVEIGAIPEDARMPTMDAERRQRRAEAEAKQAEAVFGAARSAVEELDRRAREHKQLTEALRVAERNYDLHKKLDNLLGQEGLQRELVRSAEQDIVALANETLENLTDGEMSLEPDEDATGRDDKAFALRVRKAADPHPIGVHFLSGSQKFRVAISVALAIGRFAGGRPRPLEGVIIDEGFGSLDKDGLRAMADELKRLQASQLLKRIVLVSHREEFTERFPVGYRFLPGQGTDGTRAEPFRR